MTVFLVLAVLLVAAALGCVLVPLWRGVGPAADKRREANIRIYHQRCVEIEREVASQRATRSAAEQQKDELGARLLADIDASPPPARTPRAKPRKPWLATLAVVVLIGGGGATYWKLGDWRAVDNSRMPNLPAMLGELQQQVDTRPHDLKARALLAQAQQSTGDYAAAAKNLHALNAALHKPAPALLAAEADATLKATDNLQGTARDLFGQALAADPKNRQALWYLGLAAAERGAKPKAIAYWRRLLAQKLPDNARAVVVGRLNELSGAKPALKQRAQ